MNKQILNAENRYPIEIELGLLDEKTQFLLGWPGYRTSHDKSGLGYIETQTEFAHFQGLALRWLVTGKFRTHNLIYLLAFTLFAIVTGVFPLIAILIELFVEKNYGILIALIALLPYMGVGVLLLVNVILSLLDWNGKSITGD
jgi:hypothetical protein